MEGLDYGGPAVIEPRLVRPETLRRHLSVVLPFANPKALPMFSSDAHIHNTQQSAFGADFTFAFCFSCGSAIGRLSPSSCANCEAAHESSRCRVLEFLVTAHRCTRGETRGPGCRVQSPPAGPLSWRKRSSAQRPCSSAFRGSAGALTLIRQKNHGTQANASSIRVQSRCVAKLLTCVAVLCARTHPQPKPLS